MTDIVCNLISAEKFRPSIDVAAVSLEYVQICRTWNFSCYFHTLNVGVVQYMKIGWEIGRSAYGCGQLELCQTQLWGVLMDVCI